MTRSRDVAALARTIVDDGLYMTLGTADESGRPWVSPVYYAVEGYVEFLWVSSPEATHSRNIAARPEVSIVVFDSRVPIGAAQAVYMSAVAKQLTRAELERGIEVFSRRSVAHGAGPWAASDVQAPARLRLYRATALEHSVLDASASDRDERTPVKL